MKHNNHHIFQSEFASKLNNYLDSKVRSEDIRKRESLNYENLKALDEHDQFYRDHKLLLLLFRVLGVMPIERGKIGQITFSWTSIPSIYAYCFYAFTTVIVVLVGRERLEILTKESKKFDEYIYAVIFVVFLVPHFWIPFVGWGVARQVCDYKNSWTRFQLDYFKITGRNLQFPHLSTLIVVISSGCLVLAIVFLLSLSTLLEGFSLYHTSAYLHIITMINMNGALLYINCRAIGNGSEAVADSFDEDAQNQQVTTELIALYKKLWMSLSELLQKLGNAYSRTYSTLSLFLLTNATISAYGFTSEIVDHGLAFTFKEMGLLVDFTYCMGLLFIICNCSHQATEGISKRVQTTLLNIRITKVDSLTREEIYMFLMAIQMNPPKVSLKGYTVLNRELLTNFLATIAIYLIILLQFKVSLVSQRN